MELAEEAFEDLVPEDAAVSIVMQNMMKLSEQQEELETAELARRFETLENQVRICSILYERRIC